MIDFHLVILLRRLSVWPSTTKVPSPFAWNVRRSFRSGLIHALTPSKTKRQYLSAKLSSTTRHSILARHSAISGALTFWAGRGVKLKTLNLSTSWPEQFPISTTWFMISTVGMAITHSLVLRNVEKLMKCL